MTANQSQESLRLDPARTALINVHWQYDIVSPDGAFAPFFAESVARQSILATTGKLVDRAREGGMLVVCARAAFTPGYPELLLNTALNEAIKNLSALTEGSRGAQIISEFTPQPAEPVVSHPGTSEFPTTPGRDPAPTQHRYRSTGRSGRDTDQPDDDDSQHDSSRGQCPDGPLASPRRRPAATTRLQRRRQARSSGRLGAGLREQEGGA